MANDIVSVFEVYERRCDQCLFSDARIVSEERAKALVKGILEQDRYFICHKSSLEDDGKVCCKGFWDLYQRDSLATRLALWAEAYEFVPLPSETHSEF